MPDLSGFDASVVKPEVGRDPIPAGDYVAAIVDSSMKPTANGVGHMLVFEWQILNGQFAGRRVREQLVIRHPNQDTVRISQGRLSAICHAVGVLKPTDSVQLHNISAVITVGLRKDNRPDKNGKMHNCIENYKAGGAVATNASAPRGGSIGPRPWEPRQ